MISEADSWSCFRSSATDTATAPSCHTSSFDAACSAYNSSTNCPSFSHFYRTNDFSSDFSDGYSLASPKLRQYWSSKYLHRSSFHELESNSSSVYSSCPSVRCQSSDREEHFFPPAPPTRRAESFLCVAHHLQQRAQEARQYYSGLLQQVLFDQRKKTGRMAAQTETLARNAVGLQATVQSDVEHGATFTETRISPPNGLTTPSFTPPPPIDSTHENINQPDSRSGISLPTESVKPLMFVYSYDPPTPDTTSEYDPPLPSYIESSNTKDDFQTDQDRLTIYQKVSNVQNNCRPESDLSSSTLSATLLLTQDSDMSPLPPHATRVSPMNTDTLTPSTPQAHIVTSDPAATYTCTSPENSNYSDVNPLSTDLSTISLNSFPDVRHPDTSPRRIPSPDESETLGGQTPDTICVSPLQSERCTHSHSKTSDDPSLPTQSFSDPSKPSNEGVSDPTTNASSDRARRSSPPSSPDPSLSSLPSDTITMNAAIDSIGTDSDPNDNSTWSTGNVTRDSTSRLSHHETDNASDSAFASPSTSPTFSKSCTITPVLAERQDSTRAIVEETRDEPASDQHSTVPLSKGKLPSEEQRMDSVPSEIEFADETTESESIYPESECDIRLLSRADTDGLDYMHRDSSPERQSTPIIAEICGFEADSDSSKSFRDGTNFLQPHEIRNRTLNEISSSGNSSMSNSPALSSEHSVHSLRRLNQEDLPQNSAHNTHLSNWLNENERSYNSNPGYILSLSEDLPAANDSNFSQQTNEGDESGVLIEELPSETPVSNAVNGLVRNFSYFGPLPTIHEVVDTSTDTTPANEVPPFSPVDAVDSSCSSVNAHSNSSIISYLVHSDSPQDVSTTGSSPRSKNTPVPLPNPPPPPPPRVRQTHIQTPPVPPPPSDEDAINPHPLPPLPSEEACLPPLPPPPPLSWVPDSSPPPIPAHAPTPPQRMYLLIPLAPGLRSPRRMPSPPPAPPRSTSLRRSPPPPPPRSAVQTPSSTVDYMSLETNGFRMGDIGENDIDEDIRSPSTSSDVGSVICVSKLTPVPEEKSNNSSPLPPTLLVASSENLSIRSKESKSPECRENTNVKVADEQITNRRRESSQSLSPQPSNFVPSSILPVPTSVMSGSSPPPPTPPRSKINLTPPLPPLPPPPPPKLIFTDDSTANSFHTQQRTDVSVNNMERLGSQEKTSSTTPERSAPPPPPPPKLTQKKSLVSPPSLSKELTEECQTARASPLLSVSNYGKLVVDRSDIALPPPDEELGRVFSSGVRWGWLQEGVDTIAMYTQLRPIIQHGPQCGLVALSMASQLCGGSGSSTRRPSITNPSTPTTPSSGGLCGPASTVSATDLLEAARAVGFSTHGEMFSADCLAQLANQKLGGAIEAVVRKDVLNDKHLFLELILSGALLLVPYDSQHNHQPGRFRGHKAHWGVVSGALVQSEHFASGTCTAAAFARPDPRIDCLWHVRRGYHNNASTPASRPSSRGPPSAGLGDDTRRTAVQQRDVTRRDRSSSPASVRGGRGDRQGRSITPSRGGLVTTASNQAALSAYKQICPDDMHVIPLWRQGKSRLLVSSSLAELCASNAQLTEYPKAESETGFENDFVIGNVEEGLAGKVVLLQRMTQPLTSLSELLDKLQTV